MDFDALMKKKLGGKYNKPSLVESLPQTEDGQDQAKPKNKGQKKATFKPRVTCSQCDFVGIDGKEMDIHRKKHDRSFNCEECQFVAKFRIVLRRHQIKEHNKKCHHCDFSAATSASLKMHSQAEHGGGLLSNSAGFMITGDGSEEDVATNEEIGTNEEIATNEESRSPIKEDDQVRIFEKTNGRKIGTQIKENFFAIVQRHFFNNKEKESKPAHTAWN